ncbi:Tetraspanin family-domain-containing protein [Mycena pura]|uniref:Tetraspanin family-domain-containing protein n=1 Tax=Mycena pura TaxID=153505 RepID=A0AAD6V202_9AGAR|nr:Tetraspanin family-domain-containing protein [Mycena pura]
MHRPTAVSSPAASPFRWPSSSSSEGASPRPTHSRNLSQTGSWIEPADFDPYVSLDAPPRPFSSHTRPLSVASSAAESPFADPRASTVSLSVNYVPSKFSDALVQGSARRRRHKAPVMARGGGVDAFKPGEARVADDRDDLNPYTARTDFLDRSDPKSRWTRFKWVLFLFNIVYTMIAIVALVATMLVWFDFVDKADVLRTANRPELIFSTLAAAFALFTSVFGWAGIMMNNRSFLAFYAFFLWISFALLVVPGYITYRRTTLNLESKLSFQWSRQLDTNARRRVQNVLHCCGFASPFVEASVSSTCYSRSSLPGCKAPFLDFERTALERWYIAVFSAAGFFVATIVAALLCANHVTYRFGKGMMPRAYRLDAASVALIAESYVAQVGAQYGPEAAGLVLAHASTASLLGDVGATPRAIGGMSMGAMPFHDRARARSPAGGAASTQYGTIGGTVPDTVM